MVGGMNFKNLGVHLIVMNVLLEYLKIRKFIVVTI